MWAKFNFIKYSYVSSKSACGFCRRRDYCPQKRLLKKSKVTEICSHLCSRSLRGAVLFLLKICKIDTDKNVLHEKTR